MLFFGITHIFFSISLGIDDFLSDKSQQLQKAEKV